MADFGVRLYPKKNVQYKQLRFDISMNGECTRLLDVDPLCDLQGFCGTDRRLENLELLVATGLLKVF